MDNVFEQVEIGTPNEKQSISADQRITIREIIEPFYPTRISKYGSEDNVHAKVYYDIRCYSTIAKKITEYYDEKCVIASHIDTLGAVFIIKSKMKHFSFILNHQMMGGGSYEKKVHQKDDLEVVKFLDANPTTRIHDQEEYDKLKKILLVNKLKGY